MGRKKTLDYEQTAFGERISQLQQDRGYTNSEVMEGVVDEYGNELILDEQVYNSYKSGKRKSPRDFPTLLQAFANFYNVTTDYLLKVEDTENHQVKAVTDATGLSDQSARNLLYLKDNYPEILQMIDVLFTRIDTDDITYYISLYNQIYNDFKDNQEETSDDTTTYDIVKMQNRFLRTQQAYNYISTVVQTQLAESFKKKIQQEQDEINYQHSQEYYDENEKALNSPSPSECTLEYPDGHVEVLKAESYK